MIDPMELETRFTYHKPKEEQPKRYEMIRDHAKSLSRMILEFTLESREQSLSITKIEEAVFWANAAIARREK